MTNYKELEKVLSHELKSGCNNVGVIGGLEVFVKNWAERNRNPENEGQIQQVVDAISGYVQADIPRRKSMIESALSMAHQAFAAASPEPRAKSRPTPEPRAPAALSQLPAPAAPLREPQPLPHYEPPELEDFQDDDTELAAPARIDFGLDAEVHRLQGVGKVKAAHLARLGIETVRDLLYHFPRAYRPLKNISDLMYSDEATVVGMVSHINDHKTRGGFHITDVVLMDQTGGITAKFFQQPWLAKSIRPRQYLVVSGRVDRDLNRLCFKSPEHEPLTKELERMLNAAHVYPVYPLTEGIKANWLRKTERGVVSFWADKVPEPLPAALRERANLMPLHSALREIHFPGSLASMAEARRRLAFEELLYIQLGVFQQRRKWRKEPGKALPVEPDWFERFNSALPYRLTSAQRRAIGEILKDIQDPAPMNRLLQGDVGAGKTVVATAALLAAILNGAQAALLAPTEILAEQHYRTMQKILPALSEKLGIHPSVRLLVGSMRPREKAEIHAELAAGQVDIAVGTHALIQEAVNFRDLVLAVIDEQHRFGVEQRAALRQKGYNPHILVMSATPIPRTLALTVYGDLDLSILDELPPGRQEIKTKWLEPRERERAYAFIRKQISEGRQAFVICPLIEESEAIDAKAAVEEYEHLRTQVYPDLRVGLIHGKLRPGEKEAVMNDFRDRATDILVATSVVEVGIDVPNATVMLIEGADRFGLAQLHQFRGRVGRGEHQSYCLLLAEKSGSTSDDRLKIIETTQDGFKLAEADLVLRGPGEFFGTRQSGLPDLKVAQLTDVKLLEEARNVAQEIFNRDPELIDPEHQLLKKGMSDFWHGEGDLS